MGGKFGLNLIRTLRLITVLALLCIKKVREYSLHSVANVNDFKCNIRQCDRIRK